MLVVGTAANEVIKARVLASFKNIVDNMESGGAAYVFHADTEGLNFRRAFQDAGFHLAGCCIWVKNSLVLGRSDYQWQHEPVLYGFLQNGKHKWFSDRSQTTVWNFDKPSLIRRILEKVTIYDSYFTMEFKSGVSVDIRR